MRASTRYLDLANKAGTSAVPTTGRAILNSTLTYHHYIDEELRSAELVASPQFERLDLDRQMALLLHARFFEKMYVDRKLANRQPLIQKGVTLLCSLKGTGKSTHLMAEYVGQLVDSPDCLTYYVDVLRQQSRLKTMNHEDDLCHLVYTDLRKVLSRGSGDRSLSRMDWLLFLAENNDAFREGVCRELLVDIPPLDAVRELLETNRPLATELQKKFDSEKGILKLEQLLQLLQRRGTRVILLIDNVDRCTRDFQVAIARHLIELSDGVGPLHASVVAIREENFEHLHRRLAGQNLVPPKRLFDPSEYYEGGAISWFEDVLRARVIFAREYIYEPLVPVSVKTNEVRQIELFAESFLKVSRTEKLIDSLLQWHNGSWRAASFTFCQVISRMMNPDDSLFGVNIPGTSEPDQLGSILARRQRLFRSTLYRYLILEDESVDAPVWLMSFDRGEFPLLGNLILQYIRSNSVANGPTFGFSPNVSNLIAEIAGWGFPLTSVRAALHKLTLSRGVDDSGFIACADLDDASISVLPSGRFLLENLSTSVEYLFWSAAVDLNSHDIYHAAEVTVSRSDVTDELVKAKIAIAVLEHRVLPAVTGLDARLRNHHPVSQFILNYSNSVNSSFRGFMRHSSLRPSDVFPMLRKVDAVCDRLRQSVTS
jgi:hypothetical protein